MKRVALRTFRSVLGLAGALLVLLACSGCAPKDKSQPVVRIQYTGSDTITSCVFLNGEPLGWWRELQIIHVCSYPLLRGKNSISVEAQFQGEAPLTVADEPLWLDISCQSQHTNKAITNLVGQAGLQPSYISTDFPAPENVRLDGMRFDELGERTNALAAEAKRVAACMTRMLLETNTAQVKKLLNVDKVETFNRAYFDLVRPRDPSVPASNNLPDYEKYVELLSVTTNESETMAQCGRCLILVRPQAPTNSMVNWKMSFRRRVALTNGSDWDTFPGYRPVDIRSFVFGTRHGEWYLFGEAGAWLHLDTAKLTAIYQDTSKRGL